MRPAQRVAIRLAIAVVLALVFAMYTNPHLAVELVNRVWACF